MAYVNQNGQVRIGVRGWVPVFTPEGPGTPNTIDQDSTNFIIAAGISDSVQTSAIETLVSDLKTYGLWTKMKAIYPFVGGSAASHKWNLKDPRNLDAAYRLVFNGGWVHSSTGAKPNGTTGYADTYLTPSSTLTSPFIGYYSRSNTNTGFDQIDIGSEDSSIRYLWVSAWYNGSGFSNILARNSSSVVLLNGGTTTDSRGWYWTNKVNTTAKLGKNSTILNSATDTETPPSLPITLGKLNRVSGSPLYTNRETVFSVIADGLTDSDATNLYITIQKFQTTLGRHVGTPYVSDPDAISFLNAAGITDGTQAAAINTLVIRMKADGVWTKMKAIYPFVGGNATSHKFNLKDPRDLDEAFRLGFYGGWTHTSTGALPNGTTGYADTNVTPSSRLSSIAGFGYYSRTNNITGIQSDMGAQYYFPIQVFDCTSSGNTRYFGANSNTTSYFTDSDTRGFYQIYRSDSTTVKALKNTTSYSATISAATPNLDVFIGARNENGVAQLFSLKEFAFAYIQENFTDSDATSFYNAVQAFQTTLGRQVNIPAVSDTDAQSFLNAANITSYQQASAVNKLVVDLKAAGIWTKMKAIYPFVGGSAASHKWNLKDPRDLDAAFRLVFNGGGMHSSNGYNQNYVNSWADTKFIPSTNFLSVSKASFGIYSRTLRGDSNRIAMGSNSGTGWIFIWLRNGGSTTTYVNSNFPAGSAHTTTSTNTTKGFFQSSRNNSTTQQLLNVNNVNFSSNANSSSLSTNSMFIGSINGLDSGQYVDNLEIAFAYIGDDLSPTDLTNYYTAVETYQTALGRGVNTPVYNNDLVINLDAGNANSYPGTGTTWFDLASGNNGTLTNGPTYDATNGGSIVFDGVNDYVGLGNTPIFGTSSFTIDMWIYLPISDYNYRAILSKRSNSNYTGFAVYRPPYTNSIAIQLASISSGPYFTTSISSNANSWNHVSIIVDRTSKTVILYSNGIRNTSTLDITNLGDMTNNGVNLNLGLESGIPNWNNKISTTKIYSRALSETEVINNFNSTRGRFGL